MLKSVSKRVKINALLDDASGRSYVNASIVEALGLSGHQSSVRLGVFNNTVVNIDINHMEVDLESVDGVVDVRLKVYALDTVTCGMNVTD